MRDLAVVALAVVLGLWTEVAGAQIREGTFRAVVAIATNYSGQLTRQPGLAKAAPVLDAALRSYAKSAGYANDRIDIKVLMDADGIFAKAGFSGDNDIKEAIYDAANASTNEQDTLVFFFTGHGAADGQTSILYASGADGRRPIRRVLLETEVLTARWRQSKAGVKLVVLDACQTPAGLSGGTPLLSQGAMDKWKDAGPARQQGTAIFVAAEEGERAWVDESVGYGYFTNRFAQALASGKYATAQDLIAEVIRNVEADAATSKRLQSPRLNTTASVGQYQLLPQAAAFHSAAAPSAAPTLAALSPPSDLRISASSESGLSTTNDTVYDANTGLSWVRDLNLLGSTPQIFAKVAAGTTTLKGSLLELAERVAKLSVGGVSNWRLAKRSELDTLAKTGSGSLFAAFKRSKGRPQNLLGLYESSDGAVAIWGYQYRNTLVGPISFGAGDPQLNEFGVWIVAGPTAPLAAKGIPVDDLREPVVEQVLEPIRGGLLTKTAGSVSIVPLNNDSLAEAGDLGVVRQSVYEFALKPLAGNAFVRAEILLEGAMASGPDPVLEVSTYRGDGVVQPSLFLSGGPAPTSDAVRWFFSTRSRIELPAHQVANLFNSGEILGLRFRYVGKDGSIHFMHPRVVISYVRPSDLLSKRPELSLN